MRSRTPPTLEGRCRACFFPEPDCLCRGLVPCSTGLEVVIVRHAMERWKTSNTARWTALALTQARVVDHGLRRDEAPLDELVRGGWLVFPTGAPHTPPGPLPPRLVFVDGSWSQARRMVQRLEVLQTMPRFSLPPPAAGQAHFRRPPSLAHMSTMEAVSHALELVGEPNAAAQLVALHDRAVALADAIRGAPRAP